MKQIIIFGLAILLCSAITATGIYDLSVPKIAGGTQPLSAYQDKKIMVITLPTTESTTADSSLYSLDTLAMAHQADLQVIAVPAYEDGYTPSKKDQLQQWYSSKLGNYILITDGLYVRRSSGSQQHPFFQWLTDANKNEEFDVDITAAGFKFFIKSTGELNGVLQPTSKTGGIAVQKAIRL